MDKTTKDKLKLLKKGLEHIKAASPLTPAQWEKIDKEAVRGQEQRAEDEKLIRPGSLSGLKQFTI